MVGIPAKGADQALITRLIEEWKVGRTLPGDADVGQIRAAAEAVFSDPRYRAEAERRSLAFGELDGADLAATSLETLC
jgi:UDP:flavonoid glycosyltransferase YjiC (YdhE family)